MATLNMNGSYELTAAKIDAVVTRTSPGNYALGYVNNENTFIVESKHFAHTGAKS